MRSDGFCADNSIICCLVMLATLCRARVIDGACSFGLFTTSRALFTPCRFSMRTAMASLCWSATERAVFSQGLTLELSGALIFARPSGREVRPLAQLLTGLPALCHVETPVQMRRVLVAKTVDGVNSDARCRMIRMSGLSATLCCGLVGWA